MNNSKYLYLVIPGVLLFINLFAIKSLVVPFGITAWEQSKSTYNDYNLLKESSMLGTKISKVHEDIRLAKDILDHWKNRGSGDITSVIASLYSLAESSDLKATKVEMNAAQYLKDRVETPVTINASGTFVAFGKFTEKIENVPAATRISQLVLRHSGNGFGEGSWDLIIIDKASSSER